MINNQISLEIALLGLPPFPSLILNHKVTTSAVNNTAVTEIGYWDSTLQRVELGLLRPDFDALPMWLQISVAKTILLNNKRHTRLM